MLRPVRSRSLAATSLMLLVTLSAGACARRYAAGLVGGAPARDISSAPALSTTTPAPAVKNDRKVAAVAPKPSSTPPRPRTAAHEPSAGTIGTTGVDAVVPDTPATGGGSPVVTITTTPDTDPQPAPTRARALATMISRTLKRPATAVPIGAGFAASIVSVALYRRRHRVGN